MPFRVPHSTVSKYRKIQRRLKLTKLVFSSRKVKLRINSLRCYHTRLAGFGCCFDSDEFFSAKVGDDAIPYRGVETVVVTEKNVVAAKAAIMFNYLRNKMSVVVHLTRSPLILRTSMLVQIIEIQRGGVTGRRCRNRKLGNRSARSWFEIQGFVNAVDQLVYRHVSTAAW